MFHTKINAMILNLHPKNPEIRTLKSISENLKNGAVYIFPTDTVYAIIADSKSKKGIEKLQELKHADKNKPLSLLCPEV
jgi:tRNA A37 threonylcarbamoyladenosine synthetase subunit TsaC/SUA5/YrdC